MAPKKVKEKVKAKAKGKAKAKAKEKAAASKDKAVASLSTVASLKEGYDAQANQFGYVNVTDMKAMSKLAEFLALEPDVVSKEMKAIDFDANNLVSFAEFVLWADKHTIGIPLGIDIPDKREWRKGMPAWWTSIPPPTPEEEAALKASTAGVSVAAKKTKKAKKAKKEGKGRRGRRGRKEKAKRAPLFPPRWPRARWLSPRHRMQTRLCPSSHLQSPGCCRLWIL
mmetsp:Transcript_52023/g.124499  ORF Transcript_52023/g.124499 Transcript_52023/m.124499 type:complete len:225 (+) Transcript_52023:38-712(+)